MQRSALLCGLLAAILTLTASAADVLAPGFQHVLTRSVGVNDAYATLTNGNRVVSVADPAYTAPGHVDLVAGDGTFLLALASYPGFVFPSFVLVNAAQSFALVGESTNGTILMVALDGSGAAPLSTLGYNFDAVWEDAGHVLVSAAPCGFSCGSEIDRIDLASGVPTLVAALAGPSGPLARKSNGDVYYGLQGMFGSPGTWSIVHWTQAQITGPTVLTEADAIVFAANLDGGAALKIDETHGHVFLAESRFAGPNDVAEFDAAGNRADDVFTSANWISNLELFAGPGPGSFQAFQPADGVTLTLRETDYSFFTSSILTIKPKRPRALTSGAGLLGPGSVTFSVTDALPNASYLLMISPIGETSPTEQTFDLGAYLFPTLLPINHIRRLVYVPTDLNGAGSFTYFNNGSLTHAHGMQAMIRNLAGQFIGSSDTTFN